MTADEVVLLCALFDYTGCSEAMALAVAALYCSPVERPVVPNIRFCLTATTDVDAEFDFRFDVAGILLLASLFELPDYPKRLADMRKTFGRSEGGLSRIFLHMGKVTLLPETCMLYSILSSLTSAI
ncbi:hypothetical protein KRP22_015243 [Phytophthora ramorum]|nr:hypothetical protein KRP22_15297 [Phytophthora ramorum]